MLNREFGNPLHDQERAADPLAGGLMRQGYQCGMLWGASLAAGAESFRRSSDRGRAIALAVTTTQHLMHSFSNRAKSYDCRDITGVDMSSKVSPVKMVAKMLAKSLVKGKLLYCLDLAQEWAPEAFEAVTEALSYESTGSAQTPASCASVVAQRMGASDAEIVMVAGFAGGLGLSGNACGALSAAIWMNTLTWCREQPGNKSYPNPYASQTLEAFFATTGHEMLCDKISKRHFKAVDDHSEFIKSGGCNTLINVLAQTHSSPAEVVQTAYA